MNPQVRYKVRNLLTRCATINFSNRLLTVVSEQLIKQKKWKALCHNVENRPFHFLQNVKEPHTGNRLIKGLIQCEYIYKKKCGYAFFFTETITSLPYHIPDCAGCNVQ
jgi:hypothetical protein